MVLSDDFYHSEIIAHSKVQSSFDPTPEMKSRAHFIGMAKGAVASSLLTAAFWIPAIFLFRERKRVESAKEA